MSAGPGDANAWIGAGGFNISFDFPFEQWFAITFDATFLLGGGRYSRTNATLPGLERVWSFMVSYDIGIRFKLFLSASGSSSVHIGPELDINWMSAPQRILFTFDGGGSLGMTLGNIDARIGVASRALPRTIDRFRASDDVAIFETERRLTVFAQLSMGWDVE
jgi:hypothetical protein